MSVVACIPFYNEATLIERCLDSIDGLLDRIILIDGAWENFPLWNDDFLSTDGTREIIARRRFKSQMNMLIPSRPWGSSMDKRNVFFWFGHRGDVLLYLDGNEVVLEGLPLDVTRLEADRDAWKVKMWCFEEETPGYPLRMCRAIPGLHYGPNHWTLCYIDGTPLRDEVNIGLSSIVTHDIGHLRPEWRIKLRNEYHFKHRGEDERP